MHSTADGLLLRIRDVWSLGPSDQWATMVILLTAVDDLGWYDVVDVQQLTEIPDL